MQNCFTNIFDALSAVYLNWLQNQNWPYAGSKKYRGPKNELVRGGCGLFLPAYSLLTDDIRWLKQDLKSMDDFTTGGQPIVSTNALPLTDDIWPILGAKPKSQACSTLLGLTGRPHISNKGSP